MKEVEASKIVQDRTQFHRSGCYILFYNGKQYRGKTTDEIVEQLVKET